MTRESRSLWLRHRQAARCLLDDERAGVVGPRYERADKRRRCRPAVGMAYRPALRSEVIVYVPAGAWSRRAGH
jgi:hypothetical protein